MPLPFLRRSRPLVVLLATGSLTLAACTTAADPAPADGEVTDTAGTATPAQPDQAPPEGAEQPPVALPELPELSTAGSVVPEESALDFGTNPLTEVEPVDAEPDAVSFFVDPATGVHTDSGMVTIHWAATADGVPVNAGDCRGMLSITGPEGQTLTFEPDVSGCAGSTGILLRESVGARPGDYLVQVSLDRASGEQIIHVTTP